MKYVKQKVKTTRGHCVRLSIAKNVHVSIRSIVYYKVRWMVEGAVYVQVLSKIERFITEANNP